MGCAQGRPRSRTVSAATLAASLSAGGPAAATPAASATAAIVVTSRHPSVLSAFVRIIRLNARDTSPLGAWLGCIGTLRCHRAMPANAIHYSRQRLVLSSRRQGSELVAGADGRVQPLHASLWTQG